MPSSTIDALRALGALALRQLLRPVAVMAAILLAASYALMVFLSLSFSAWWWLLLIILFPVTFICLVIAGIAWLLTERLLPRRLTRDERRQLLSFTSKVTSLAERGRLPFPLLLVVLARDVVWGRESSYLRSIIGDSKQLTREFHDIRELF